MIKSSVFKSSGRAAAAAGRWIRGAGATFALALLASCGGGSNTDNAPATAPTGFAVEAVDGGVIVTWNQEPGLTYWIFSAAAPSINRDNYRQFPGARITQPATSPQLISGLFNGTTYSFFINASNSGSAAGPATASIAATPRLAGTTWTLGSTLAADLNAMAFGFGKYVAVGGGGAVFTRPALIVGDWTATPSGVTAALNGVTAGALLVAVGDGGTILSSGDGLAWTARTSGVSTRLNDVTAGNGTYVAVGDGGVLLRSSDATTWTAVSTGVTANFTGAGFINNTFFALAADGSLLTSTDATTWTARTSGVTTALRAVTFGAGRYVVVGDGGAILTSTDLATWTAATSGTTQNLRRIVLGSRLLAAGDAGTVLLSTDGLTWTVANSGTTGSIRGLLRGIQLEYLYVGAGGLNAISR